MAIIILPVCFIAIFLNLGIYLEPGTKKRELLLCSVLAFSVLVLVITEVLSAFQAISFTPVFIAWSLVTLWAMVSLYRNKSKLAGCYRPAEMRIKYVYNRLLTREKVMLAAVAVVLAIIFVQGIIYPPNNWDSLSYHLARIASWVSHHTVGYFPTHITRQLYQPPFSEYVILHVNILYHSDRFAAAVQFCFFVFSLVAIAAIIQRMRLRRFYQLTGVVLAVTIPEVVLQASSTQNDVVVAFFILSSCYFALKAIEKNRFVYYLFTGLSVGFALLTKGTAYIYLAPVLLFFGIFVLVKLVKTKKLTYLVYGLACVVLVIAVNFISFARNYNLTSNLLGIDARESKMYANERMSPGLLFSSIIKNAGMHSGIKYTTRPADLADKIIYSIHTTTGIPINDKAVNYSNIRYDTHTLTTFEDSAPNLLHFILIALSFGVIIWCAFKRKLPGSVIILMLILVIQIVLFCGYLKWQPWHSRLHVPIFLISMPVICYAASISKGFKRISYVLLPVLVLYALSVVAYNQLRPLKPHELGMPRFQQYFYAKPGLYLEYAAVNREVRQSNYKNIGLILTADDWQYPLFNDCYSRELNPVHINVKNFSKGAGHWPHNVDCIISTTLKSKQMRFKGNVYVDRSPNNKYIHLYELK